LEPETNIFKCESCLMCEKACPPRAISISYKFRNGFRKRPPIAPRSSYYRIRMVAAAPYGALLLGGHRRHDRRQRAARAEEERELDLGPMKRILAQTPETADRL